MATAEVPKMVVPRLCGRGPWWFPKEEVRQVSAEGCPGRGTVLGVWLASSRTSPVLKAARAGGGGGRTEDEVR